MCHPLLYPLVVYTSYFDRYFDWSTKVANPDSSTINTKSVLKGWVGSGGWTRRELTGEQQSPQCKQITRASLDDDLVQFPALDTCVMFPAMFE